MNWLKFHSTNYNSDNDVVPMTYTSMKKIPTTYRSSWSMERLENPTHRKSVTTVSDKEFQNTRVLSSSSSILNNGMSMDNDIESVSSTSSTIRTKSPPPIKALTRGSTERMSIDAWESMFDRTM